MNPNPNIEDFRQRRQRVAQAIGPDGIAIIPAAVERVRNRDVHYRFRQDSDFRYLTGFNEPDAIAVIAPGHEDGEFILFCRPRDKEREIWDGLRAGPEGVVKSYGADAGFALAELDERMPQLMASRKTVYFTLGANAAMDGRVQGWIDALRGMVRRGVTAPDAIVTLDSVVHPLRLIKSTTEIELMRHASQVSAAAHSRAMRECAPGRYEYQLMAALHHEFEMHAMEPGYGTIVGAGANACILHYVENSAELRDGDLCLIDAGAEYHGYSADITRTFPVNGKFSGPQKDLYELVLASQEAAIDQVRAGNAYNQPHETVVRMLTSGMVDLGLLSGEVDGLIESEAYKAYFMHNTGHWLGMDVHDVGAYKVDGDWRPLEPGMVVTIEPGLYVGLDSDAPEHFKGIGIRIEDDVVVTDGAPDVLTSDVPKSVAEIEALMAA